MTPDGLAGLVGAAGAIALIGAIGMANLAPVRQPDRAPVTPRPQQRAGLGERRRRRHLERRLDATFPELLDLLVVSIQAGLLPAQAVTAATAQVDGPLRDALTVVQDRVCRGERFTDALQALVDLLGPRALGMVATIASTQRHGLPLGPALERLADEARAQRRRHAEAAARELPVRLAFPLVLCTLPSFALVAIVPLLTGALSSLRSS